MFALLAERRTFRLVAADDGLLLLQRRAVPTLDERSDDTHNMIGATPGPGRLVVAIPDPDDPVHQPSVGGIEVGRDVLEAEEVAGRVASGRLDGVGWEEARLRPAQRLKIGEGLQNIAQRVDVGFGRIGVELNQEVAVAAIAIERVIGKARHGNEPLRTPVGQAEAFVEERCPEGYGHREIVGKPLGTQ